MAEYKKMYTTLFNKITDAITLLQEAQTEAEEMFLEEPKSKIIMLDKPEQKED